MHRLDTLTQQDKQNSPPTDRGGDPSDRPNEDSTGQATFWAQAKTDSKASGRNFPPKYVTEENKGEIFALLEMAHIQGGVHQTDAAMKGWIKNQSLDIGISEISLNTWKVLSRVYCSLCRRECAESVGRVGRPPKKSDAEPPAKKRKQTEIDSRKPPPILGYASMEESEEPVSASDSSRNWITAYDSESQTTIQLSPRVLKDKICAKLASELELFPVFCPSFHYTEQILNIKYMTDMETSKHPWWWFENTRGRLVVNDCSAKADGRCANAETEKPEGDHGPSDTFPKECLLRRQIAGGEVHNLGLTLDRAEYRETKTATQLWLQDIERSHNRYNLETVLDAEDKKLDLLQVPEVRACLRGSSPKNVGEVRRDVVAVIDSVASGSFNFYNSDDDESPVVKRKGTCGVSFLYCGFERKRVDEKSINTIVANEVAGLYPYKAGGEGKPRLLQEARSWFRYGPTQRTVHDSGKTISILVDNSQVTSKRPHGEMEAHASQRLDRQASSYKSYAEIHLEGSHHSEEDIEKTLQVIKASGLEILGYRVECLKVAVAATPHELHKFADDLRAGNCLVVGDMVWNVVSVNPAFLVTESNKLPVEPCPNSSFCGIVREKNCTSWYTYFRGMEEENQNPRFAGISDKCVVQSFKLSVPEGDTTRIGELQRQGFFQVEGLSKQNHVIVARDCFRDHGTMSVTIPKVIQCVSTIDGSCYPGLPARETIERPKEDIWHTASIPEIIACVPGLDGVIDGICRPGLPERETIERGKEDPLDSVSRSARVLRDQGKLTEVEPLSPSTPRTRRLTPFISTRWKQYPTSRIHSTHDMDSLMAIASNAVESKLADSRLLSNNVQSKLPQFGHDGRLHERVGFGGSFSLTCFLSLSRNQTRSLSGERRGLYRS